MTIWARFEQGDAVGFGTVDNDTISVYEGDMFDGATATGDTVGLGEVKLLAPCQPTKMIALWNNFHALAAKMDVPEPAEPLYLLKGNNSFLGPNELVRRPSSYDGKVTYEGELGIVIGKQCKEVSEAQAADCIFGFTCVNDVTAAELISKDKTFAQWARAKSFDTFGVYGPVIATDIEPSACNVVTVLNGAERQNYALSDMIFPSAKLTSLISHDMTLMPGDVICCGTSLGVGSMKEASNTITVTIEGIGTLSNVFE